MRFDFLAWRQEMKILIVSDTHRKNDNYLSVLEKEKPLDFVIHCGDAEGSEYLLEESAGCPLHIVLGNNDFFSRLPREKEFFLGKYKVFLAHGHTYGVGVDDSDLISEAILREANLLIYGHTHRPLVEIREELVILNPGSLSYPRQEGKLPSYIIMEIDKKGEASFSIKHVEK